MSDTSSQKEPKMAADDDLETLTFDVLDEEEDDGAHPEELPARPRRRLLTPLTVALLLALTAACGFIAGVQIQKGQTSSSSPGLPSGIAARLGALRSRGSGGGSGFSFPGGAGGFPGAGAADGTGSGFTAGEVAYIRGSTLYVTDDQGNTVKVTTSGSKVSKTVSTGVNSIRPGDTVVVQGSQTKRGGIEASSISLSSSGSSSAATGASPSKAGTSGTPALFGSGG